MPRRRIPKRNSPIQFPYTYNTKNDQTAEKVSHPQVAPNSKDEGSRRNDGIVDYIGNGQIANNVGYGDDSGCRGQSYSWSAMAYGDWIYTGLNYNALGQTVQLMDVGLGHKYDPELLPGILNVPITVISSRRKETIPPTFPAAHWSRSTPRPVK